MRTCPQQRAYLNSLTISLWRWVHSVLTVTPPRPAPNNKPHSHCTAHHDSLRQPSTSRSSQPLHHALTPQHPKSLNVCRNALTQRLSTARNGRRHSALTQRHNALTQRHSKAPNGKGEYSKAFNRPRGTQRHSTHPTVLKGTPWHQTALNGTKNGTGRHPFPN